MHAVWINRALDLRTPSKTEEEYADIDDSDMLSLDNLDFLFKCAKIDNPEGFYFK